MSQNYLILPPKSQQEFRDVSICAAEIFEKAWTLSFGNSFIEMTENREIESRFYNKGNFNFFIKIEKDKHDSEKIYFKYVRLNDRLTHDSIHLENGEIERNLKFSRKKPAITALLNIFEENKDILKRIKMMQKKLLLEINKFHELNKKNV